MALTRRVAAALETASARGGVVAVVTHRMAIAAAVSLCLPIDLSRPAAPCANGSITTIRRVEDGRWVLVAPGDGDHLA